MALSLKEQFQLPLVKDLIQENKRIQHNLSTKLPDSEIENIKIPYRVKNRLLINSGEHNGVYYPKDELEAAVSAANDKSLILDHKDTSGEGASNWVGRVENVKWDNGSQGAGLYGDLVIVDKPTAQKLAAGAKLGVSATVDFEKNELADKMVATELAFKSYSLVIDPAVRETMLNSKQKGDNMSEDEKDSKENLKDKRPYKYPKKKKDDKKEMSRIDVSQEALQLLEEKDKKIKQLSEELDTFKTEKKEQLVGQLCDSEFLIGRLEPTELQTRKEELMDKSVDILNEIHSVIGSHAELASYREFVKKYLKDHKDADIKDAAKAWKKQKKKGSAKNASAQMKVTDKEHPTASLKQVSMVSDENDSDQDEAQLSQENIKPCDEALRQHLVGMAGVRK